MNDQGQIEVRHVAIMPRAFSVMHVTCTVCDPMGMDSSIGIAFEILDPDGDLAIVAATFAVRDAERLYLELGKRLAAKPDLYRHENHGQVDEFDAVLVESERIRCLGFLTSED